MSDWRLRLTTTAVNFLLTEGLRSPALSGFASCFSSTKAPSLFEAFGSRRCVFTLNHMQLVLPNLKNDGCRPTREHVAFGVTIQSCAVTPTIASHNTILCCENTITRCRATDSCESRDGSSSKRLCNVRSLKNQGHGP